MHKLTIYLAQNHSEIVIGDLNVSGMLKNGHLAKARRGSNQGNTLSRVLKALTYKDLNYDLLEGAFKYFGNEFEDYFEFILNNEPKLPPFNVNYDVYML